MSEKQDVFRAELAGFIQSRRHLVGAGPGMLLSDDEFYLLRRGRLRLTEARKTYLQGFMDGYLAAGARAPKGVSK